MTYSEWQTWTLTCRSEEEADSLLRRFMVGAGAVRQEGLTIYVYARASTIEAALAQFGLVVTVPYQEGEARPPEGEPAYIPKEVSGLNNSAWHPH